MHAQNNVLSTHLYTVNKVYTILYIFGRNKRIKKYISYQGHKIHKGEHGRVLHLWLIF